MRCRECDEPLVTSVKRCPRCGTSVEQAGEVDLVEPAPPPQKEAPTRGPAVVPVRRARLRSVRRGVPWNVVVAAVVAAGVGIAAYKIYQRVRATQAEPGTTTVLSKDITVAPGEEAGETFTAGEDGELEFTVRTGEVEVEMCLMAIAGKDRTDRERDFMKAKATRVPPNRSVTFTETGPDAQPRRPAARRDRRYVWSVANRTDRSAKVHVEIFLHRR